MKKITKPKKKIEKKTIVRILGILLCLGILGIGAVIGINAAVK